MSTNNLLTEINYPQQTTPIYENNQACITLALQEASKHKTKHILTKVHYIRDLIQKKVVDIILVYELYQYNRTNDENSLQHTFATSSIIQAVDLAI
jgi:hypothetical protein